MKRIVPLLLAIVLGGLSARPAPAAATPPSPPPCNETPFPTAYIGPLVSTETWGLFTDWRVEKVSLPRCQAREIPYDLAIVFLLPASYSSRGLSYRLWVQFSFDERARLTNAKRIRVSLLNLDEKITGFEHDPVIEQYLAIAKDPSISTYIDNSSNPHQEQIELKIDGDNAVVYDLTARHVVRLRFAHPALIANKEQLVPLIASSPLAQEFESRIGINYVDSSIETLVIAESHSRHPSIALDPRSGGVEYFSVPNQPAWRNLPHLAGVHAAIERHGYDRQVPSCAIDGHSAQGRRDSSDRDWIIDVTLECTAAARSVGWKSAQVRVDRNGSISEPVVTGQSISGTFGASGLEGREAGWARQPALVAAGVLAGAFVVGLAIRQVMRKRRQS